MNYQKAVSTPRQATLLRRILDGASYSDIASESGITGAAIRLAVDRLLCSLSYDVEIEGEDPPQRTTAVAVLRLDAARWLRRLETFEGQLPHNVRGNAHLTAAQEVEDEQE